MASIEFTTTTDGNLRLDGVSIHQGEKGIESEIKFRPDYKVIKIKQGGTVIRLFFETEKSLVDFIGDLQDQVPPFSSENEEVDNGGLPV